MNTDIDGVLLIDQGRVNMRWWRQFLGALGVFTIVDRSKSQGVYGWCGDVHIVDLPVWGIWRKSSHVDEQSLDLPMASVLNMCVHDIVGKDWMLVGLRLSINDRCSISSCGIGKKSGRIGRCVITMSGTDTDVVTDSTKIQLMRHSVQSHP